MSEYVKSISQIRVAASKEAEDEQKRKQYIKYSQIGVSQGNDVQAAPSQDQGPFQFDRFLQFLKKSKEDKQRNEQDLESMVTRSSESETNRVQASTLIKRQKNAEDERVFIIQRIKKFSLLLFYFALLGLALRSITGFGANCKRDQTWSIFEQECQCDQQWQKNHKGICVNKCSHFRQYNVTTGECLSCPNSWQHVYNGNVCSDRCNDNLLWYDQENDCGACPDFWQWVEKDNKCVDRCKGGKSFNRYMNDETECLNLYDLFDEIASDNDLLAQHKETNMLGGSLSDDLDCGVDTIAIQTPFSQKQINTTGYQYVEFVSSTDPQLSYHERTRMFISSHDYRKFDNIIDTEDNESNQCYTNDQACWLELIKFQHRDDIYFVKEGFKSDGTNNIVIEGQWRFGEQSALIRITDIKGTELSWRSNNELHGKTFQILAGQSLCQKQLYKNNNVIRDYSGNDMTTPF